MEAKDHNYGVAEDEVAREHGPVTMGTQEERTLSVLAHLSMFLNIVTGFLGPVAALVFCLVYRGRSRDVACQALESMGYQVAWLVILVSGWAVTGLVMFALR